MRRRIKMLTLSGALLIGTLLCGASPVAAEERQVTIEHDVVYGHKAGMALTYDVITPQKPNGAGVLFMVSGGWVSTWFPAEAVVRPNTSVQNQFEAVVDRGYTLFLVRHGSSPYFKVPDAVADVRRAVRFVRLHADDYGVDPDRLGVCGGSAGGHLSLMLGTASDEGDAKALDPVLRVSDRVAAVVAYFPPVLLDEYFELKDRFPALDFDPALAESVSPLLHVTSDDAPTLLVHGDQDDLVELKDSERIHDAFESAKVDSKLIVMKGAGHGFGGDQDKQARDALIAWFDAHLKPDANGQSSAPATPESPANSDNDTSTAGDEPMPLPTADPQSLGFDPDVLDRIEPAMQKLIDEDKLAGAITIVARNGKIAYFETVGDRDRAGRRPMEKDTIVRIYSMTKPVTSAAIMMLAEEGKLALDDPIEKHIPQLADWAVFVERRDGQVITERAKRPPTIRDLLRHTAGLTYGFFGNTPVDQQYRAAGVLAKTGTLEETIDKLADIPLLYQPGTRFNYSVSTDVLGRIVEVTSGKTLDEFFVERIFEPLGMDDTGFFVPTDKLDRFATNYGSSPTGDLIVIDGVDNSRYRERPALLSGGGGLVSTASDYIRFCQMLLNKGELNGQRLLQSISVEQMTRNQLPDEAYPIAVGDDQRAGVGFGLGFSVIVEPVPGADHVPVGEYGWGGAASTHFWISPKDDLAVVVLTQKMPFTFQAETAVKRIVYEALGDE